MAGSNLLSVLLFFLSLHTSTNVLSFFKNSHYNKYIVLLIFIDGNIGSSQNNLDFWFVTATFNLRDMWWKIIWQMECEWFVWTIVISSTIYCTYWAVWFDTFAPEHLLFSSRISHGDVVIIQMWLQFDVNFQIDKYNATNHNKYIYISTADCF